ncbi:hypothetical protein PYCC9005_005671 [Savitreella phatthalungensis]
MLSQADVHESIARYEELLQRAKIYRNALADLAKASNGLGAALEDCSRGKGLLDELREPLTNASGVQFLIANHQNILSDTFYRTYEIPLRDALETFVVDAEQRREEYGVELARKKKQLNECERKHLKLAQRRTRGLGEFREALQEMTTLADSMDKLKRDYSWSMLDEHREAWQRVATRSNVVLKATLQLYGAVANKGEQLEWSLVGVEDPWAAEGAQQRPSILPRPQSPRHTTPAADAGLFASLLGNVEDEPAQQRIEEHVDEQRRLIVTPAAIRRPMSRGSARSRSRQLVPTAAALEGPPLAPFEDAEEPPTPTLVLSQDVSPRRRQQQMSSTPSRPTTRASGQDTTPRKKQPPSQQQLPPPKFLSSRSSGSASATDEAANASATLAKHSERPFDDVPADVEIWQDSP